MEGAQRRRIRDFVALAIVTVWLCGISLLAFVRGPSIVISGAMIGFLATFVDAALRSRPRPMDRRVLRPIVTGSLLLGLATLAPNVDSELGGNPYVGIGASLGVVAVAVLVVRSQVLKIVGGKPSRRVNGWPIVDGGHHEVPVLGGQSMALLAHTLFGWSLASLALALSTDALRVLAAEVLVIVMLVITLAYVRSSKEDPGERVDRRAEAERNQLLLISWGLFGYLAFVASVGTALPPPTFAAGTFVFYAAFFIFAAAFLRWRRRNRGPPA